MEIVRSVANLQQYTCEFREKGCKIGFVPTMGFLHEGHQRLMQQARAENDIVIASIFVNPLQFGANEDYETYPRNENQDVSVSKSEKVDILFIPTVAEMYPEEPSITMQVTKRTEALCGKSRPGHFDGVVTVLSKLFHIVNPHNVYFGKKDAQQVAVVDALVKDLNFPVTIVPVDTVRENDGLAKSSRNVNLTKEEREEAKFLYKALRVGHQSIIDGEKNPITIVKEVKAFIKQHTRGKIDYVELLDYPELTSIDEISGQVILAVAVFFDKVRLIDNMIIQLDNNSGMEL
ncbi:pantoate--beta-alanine ligase [Sediminibacillus massiliensis]|uniref:pantoate--beta-alanine ligase n=1 Tax=Sediminibacillus massiliensis TaxID=1926277 RepID=UPI0009883452|nr:pantoate--beta-alanine ligase [Sediminibacillus massiliensis]